jgi:hypothetical protein
VVATSPHGNVKFRACAKKHLIRLVSRGFEVATDDARRAPTARAGEEMRDRSFPSWENWPLTGTVQSLKISRLVHRFAIDRKPARR